MAKTKIKTPGTDLTATAATGAVIAQGTPSVTDGYITLNCDQNTHGVKIKSPPHSAGQNLYVNFTFKYYKRLFFKNRHFRKI